MNELIESALQKLMKKHEYLFDIIDKDIHEQELREALESVTPTTEQIVEAVMGAIDIVQENGGVRHNYIKAITTAINNLKTTKK